MGNKGSFSRRRFFKALGFSAGSAAFVVGPLANAGAAPGTGAGSSGLAGSDLAGSGLTGSSALGSANTPNMASSASYTPSNIGSSETGWVMGRKGSGPKGKFLAGDLQVVTVTEDSATISWLTWDAKVSIAERPVGMPTEGTLRVWPEDNPQDTKIVRSEKNAFFHIMTVEGLQPETTYRFSASSHGVEANATHNYFQENKREFTTLPRLSGDLLQTVIVANDLHMGEAQDGLWFDGFPPPAVPNPKSAPYPEVCLDAVIQTAEAYGATHLFVNGDVTSEARPAEVRRAKEMLDKFSGTWRVTRGNHDRPHKADGSSGYETATPYGKEHFDPFGDVFEPRQQAWMMDLEPAGVRVIGIDSTELDKSGGRIEPQQFRQIEGFLRRDPNKPTVLMLHHPMTREAGWSNAAGPAFILRDPDLIRLQKMIQAAPGVKLVLAGHTHRAHRDKPDLDTHAVFLETPAAKNWPTGATQLRFYSDGIAVNFRHNMGEEALDWASRTRWTNFGLAPEILLGPTDARNLVVRY